MTKKQREELIRIIKNLDSLASSLYNKECTREGASFFLSDRVDELNALLEEIDLGKE